MRSPRRRATALVVTAVTLLGVAACGGVPDSGPVRDERSLPLQAEADDVRVLAQSAHAGQSPTEVVRGFLRAAASFDDDHAVARTYLSARSGSEWRPEGAVVYTDAANPQLTIVSTAGGTTTVAFTAPRVADLDADGTWKPAPQGSFVRDRFTLVRQAREWRISSPPSSLRLTPGDIERSYRAVSVFFLSPSRDVVVPDHRYLPVERRALSTALVRSLLAGPSKAIAPAVRTAVPSGTNLIGTAPVVDGVVTVDLTRAVLDADPRGLVELSAQLVWTLRELGTEFSELRLLAEGSPLKVAGAPTVQRASTWSQFDPDEDADVGAYLDAAGRLTRVGQGRTPGPLGRGTLRLAAPALGPSDRVVAGIGAGPSLWAGALEAPRKVATGLAFTAPSIDHSERVWAVQRTAVGQRVVMWESGTVRTIRSDLPTAGVSALRVSRDGARVAAVVNGRLLVGRVQTNGQDIEIAGLTPVAPDLLAVSSVNWADSDDLVLLARTSPSGRASPWFVSSDGYRVQAAPTTGESPSGFVSLAAGPGSAPLLAADKTSVYRYVGGRWTQVERGSSPTYPG